MNGWKTKLVVTLSALALLAGCDDGGSSSSSANNPVDNVLGWFQKDEESPQALIGRIVIPNDYVQETQSGNYLAAQFAQFRQDWGVANDYLDKMIAMDPTNIELLQRAMVLAMQAGDTNRAIALARKVQAADEQNVLALLFIGVDQMARQEYEASVKTFESMPKSGMTDFIQPILIAWATAPKSGLPQDALLLGHGPFHAYHALLIADYLGSFKDADKYFASILMGGDVDGHILETVADVFARRGKEDFAIKIYDALIEQYQKNPDMTESLVRELTAKRNNPAAVKTGQIQTPEEGAAEAFYNMTRILYQDNSDDSALVFSRLAARLAPNNDNVKLITARMMMRNDHVDDAIAIYKSIHQDNEDFLDAQRSAAELMEQEGRLDESVAYLEDIYAKHKDVGALIQIGDAYRRVDKHAEAIKAYNRAEEALGGTIDEANWNLLYARGMSYERSGNLTRAEEDLEKALAYRPNHPYLLNYLGYSWADQGKNLDRSMELILKAAVLMPEDGYIIDSLGWVYYMTGEYQQAVNELEKAVELIPYDPTINDHLGDAYWQVGRKQEARFQWLRALNHAEEGDDVVVTAIQEKLDNGLSSKTPAVLQAKKDLAPSQGVKAQ